MEHEEQLSRAIGNAVGGVVPDNIGDFVIGDQICIAEILVNNGDIGLAVFAPTMTQRHLLLLTRALDQTVNSLIDTQETEGDADAA